MRHARCTFTLTLAAFAAVALPLKAAQSPAMADYPTKPIRFVVPFPPGGGTDITARTIAQKLTGRWSQQVVVDNRPGANGTIGVDITAKSAPDGYTVTMISSSHAVNVSLYAKLPYDLIRDLAPVTQATAQPYALVINPSVPARSVKELVSLARAKPGTLNYGSSGAGGLSHLSGALLASLAGVNLTHIPYKGGALAVNDLIAGQIQMQFGTLLLTNAHVKSGRLRSLAVTTAKRAPAAPELPTMVEAGVPGYEVAQWYGILAPAKVPPAIIVKLSKEIARSLHEPDVKPRLAADGSDAVGNTPEEFGTHVRSEVAKWAKLTKQLGLKAD